ncbi:MAG TPA: transporter substrate-binding domain-containing protein [Noviherbaspirillum sp.]|nr:transporter substrate-binding domain-containing protein [Noviherbaspirillum sp.]
MSRSVHHRSRRCFIAGAAVFLLGAWLPIAAPAADKAGARPWIIAADASFPPYAYLDPANGRPSGLDTEIVSAALDAVGQPHEIRLFPWERAKKMLESGQVDAAYQFVGTPERRSQYRLAGPIRNGVTVFMARKDGPADYRTLADLQPYLLGTVHGFAYTEEFDRAPLRKDGGAVNVEQLLRKLLAGRVDVIVGDRSQLLFLARRMGVAGEVKIIGRPLAEVPRFVGFPKGGEQQAVRFEKGLEIIRQNGTLNRITARWERQ